MGCKTRVAGRVINERCDICKHSLHWHNIIHHGERNQSIGEMPEDGWPCLACDWEARLAVLEARMAFALGSGRESTAEDPGE